MLRKLAVAVAAAVVSVTAAPALAGDGFFVGFTEDSPKWFGSAAVDPARSAGARAFRITLPWAPGQTTLAAVDREALDRSVAALGSLRLVLAVYGRAVDAPKDAASREAYCTYVRNILAEYRSIRDVVIWNEPNMQHFWSPQFNPDGSSAAPAAYAQLLQRCYPVLHAARADVNVIGIALSPRGNDDPGATSLVSHSPGNFIRMLGQAYRAGGGSAPLLDTVGHHVYGLSSAERPWLRHIQHKTIAQGDWNKLMWNLHTAFSGTAQQLPGECSPARCVRIWYLEGGFQTVTDPAKASAYTGRETEGRPVAPSAGGEPDSPPPAADSLAPDQATQFRDAVRLAYCQPHVESFFNFLLFDEQALERWQSAPFWADWTPKPSWDFFRAAIAEANARTIVCSQLKGGQPSADYLPPTAPAGVTAAPLGDPLRVLVSWQPAGDDVGVATYRVYRDGAHVGTTSETSWTNVSVTAGSTYAYAVRALDAAGNLSDASAPATVTAVPPPPPPEPAPPAPAPPGPVVVFAPPPDVTPPGAPASVAAQVLVGPARVQLAWPASADDRGVAGYRVYRDGVLVGTPDGPAFLDSSVADASTYVYAVRAFDAAGNTSAPSPDTAVRTAPPPPSRLSGRGTDAPGRVTLDWADTADDQLAGYAVHRASTPGGDYARVATVSRSAYSEAALAGKTSYYVVTALNRAGSESARSAEIAVTPRGVLVRTYRARRVAGGAAAATVGQPRAAVLSLRVDAARAVYDRRAGRWLRIPRAWTTRAPARYVSARGVVRLQPATRTASPRVTVRF